MDEVGDEHHPLMGLRSGDDLPLGRKPVGDFLGQVPRLPELRMSFSLMEETIHLPYAPDPDMVGVLSWGGKDENLGAGARERGRQIEREKAWVKGVNPYLFIKAVNIKRLPTRPKNSPIPKGRADDTVGLPMLVLMRIPQ